MCHLNLTVGIDFWIAITGVSKHCVYNCLGEHNRPVRNKNFTINNSDTGFTIKD